MPMMILAHCRPTRGRCTRPGKIDRRGQNHQPAAGLGMHSFARTLGAARSRPPMGSARNVALIIQNNLSARMDLDRQSIWRATMLEAFLTRRLGTVRAYRLERSMNRVALLLAAAVLFTAEKTAAQPVSEFYAGKQITFIVGASTGGGYDRQARLVARHLGKHIPGNPTIIVQNMPGAGSLAATNYIYNAAARDGSVIALVMRSMLLIKNWNPQSVRFDLVGLNWIGSINSEVAVAAAWHTAPHKSANDLFREGVDRRRHHRRRSGDDAAALERAARHEVQDRQRLSRHHRNHSGDGKGRIAGHRRLVMVEHQGCAAGLAARQENHPADAGRPR